MFRSHSRSLQPILGVAVVVFSFPRLYTIPRLVCDVSTPFSKFIPHSRSRLLFFPHSQGSNPFLELSDFLITETVIPSNSLLNLYMCTIHKFDAQILQLYFILLQGTSGRIFSNMYDWILFPRYN